MPGWRARQQRHGPLLARGVGLGEQRSGAAGAARVEVSQALPGFFMAAPSRRGGRHTADAAACGLPACCAGAHGRGIAPRRTARAGELLLATKARGHDIAATQRSHVLDHFAGNVDGGDEERTTCGCPAKRGLQ